MSDEANESLTLRVAKAIPSDVGHGRARVPFDNELTSSQEISSKSPESSEPPLSSGAAGPRMPT